MNQVRDDALDIFRHALNTSRVDVAMERRVRFDGPTLRIDRHSYSLDEYDRLVLIALGKAAGTMARAFLRQAGPEGERFEGVVVAPVGTEGMPSPLRTYFG